MKSDLLPLPRKCKKCGMLHGAQIDKTRVVVVVAQGCPPLVPYFWGCTRCYPNENKKLKQNCTTVQLEKRGFLGDFPDANMARRKHR